MQAMTDLTQNPIAQDVAENPYAFPGAYPRFALTDDCGTLCPTCCAENATEIAESVAGDGWHVIADEINWEDHELMCDHCGKHIECAYQPDGDN
jgi:hypothetical protein